MITLVALLATALVTALLTGFIVHQAQERKIRDINQDWQTQLAQVRAKVKSDSK